MGLNILRPGLRKRSTFKSGGTLTCTWCGSNKLKFVERVFPDRDIYKCKVCGVKITYIATPMSIDDPERMFHKSEHPYRHLPRLPKVPIVGGMKIKSHKIK